MIHEDTSTYPFWTDRQAELEQIRIGLSEAFLEAIDEELVGLDWTVGRGRVRKGDTLGLLHTSHRAIDLKAPFAMEIVNVNDEALQDPRLIRTSPYYEGWLAEVRRC